MAAVTSFHAEKSCHLVNECEKSAGHLCSSVVQFLICSISVLALPEKAFHVRL